MSDFESAKGFCARPPRSARLRAGARFALAPGLPRNDVGHEKVTRGGVVDSRAYRRPTRITRRHLFRSGSARLGLSQKGDLPSSGEPVGFCWFKVANARMFDGGPRLLARVHDLPGG